MKSESRATAPWARICYGIDDRGGIPCVVRAERRGRRVLWQGVPFDADVLCRAAADGAAIAVGMPVGLGLAAWVVAPFASRNKAQRVFPTLLDIQLPFPLEDCVYGFTEMMTAEPGNSPTGGSGGSAAGGVQVAEVGAAGGVAALAFAARRIDVGRRLAELTETGVDPHVLDYEGFALWTQSLREHPAEDAEASGIRVVVFMRGDEGIMVMGRGDIFWSAHRLSASEPASMDRYLRAQLNQRGLSLAVPPPAVAWFWAGSQAGLHEAGALLRADVEPRWPGRSTTLEAPEAFLARALATRALMPGPLRANLRSGPYAHAGAQAHAEGSSLRSAVIVLVAGLLLLGASGGWERMIAGRREAFSAQFTTGLNRMLGYPVKAKGSNAFLIAERELTDRTQRRKPLADAFSPSLLEALQRTLAGLNPHDISVAHLELTAERTQIKGTLPARALGAPLCASLESEGHKVDITVGDADSEGQFGFVLTVSREGRHE